MLAELVQSRVPGVQDRVQGSPEAWCGKVARAVEKDFDVFSLLRDDSKIHLVRVQGERCKTVDSAAESIANALEFPAYYGRNLDAFNECLNDLLDVTEGGMGSAGFGHRGRPTDKLLLLVDSASQFLVEAPQNTAAIFLGILADASLKSGEWSDHQAEFFVLFLAEELPHIVGTYVPV